MGIRMNRVGRFFLGLMPVAAAWPAFAGPGDVHQAAQAGAPVAAASTQPLGLALLGAGLFMFWLYARRKQGRS